MDRKPGPGGYYPVDPAGLFATRSDAADPLTGLVWFGGITGHFTLDSSGYIGHCYRQWRCPDRHHRGLRYPFYLSQ